MTDRTMLKVLLVAINSIPRTSINEIKLKNAHGETRSLTDSYQVAAELDKYLKLPVCPMCEAHAVTTGKYCDRCTEKLDAFDVKMKNVLTGAPN